MRLHYLKQFYLSVIIYCFIGSSFAVSFYQTTIDDSFNYGKYDITIFNGDGFDELQATVLVGGDKLCFNLQSKIGSYIMRNSKIELYNTKKDKDSLICVQNDTQKQHFIINNNKVTLDLTDQPVALSDNKDINNLLLENTQKIMDNLDDGNLPLPLVCSTLREKLSQNNAVCEPLKSDLANVLLGRYQPPAFIVNLNIANNINLESPKISQAQEYKTPYKELSETEIKQLTPQLLVIRVNNNPPINNQVEIVYLSDNAACFTDAQLDKNSIGNDHSIFYEYQIPNNDPIADSSLKCLVNSEAKTYFAADMQLSEINLNLRTDSVQNINLSLTNEPVYASGQIYANSSSYQLYLQQSSASASSSASFNGNLTNTQSTPFGSLMNGFALSSTSIDRNYTYWQADFPSLMTSLIVGDAVPLNGNWGGSLNFSGLQYGSNVGLRPGYFFTSTPIISGEVSVPTTVEILMNGAQSNHIDIPAGSFNLYNLPILNGDGTVTVNVLNPNNNSYQSVTLPYYSSPKVLADSTYLYQYNLGVPQGANVYSGLKFDYITSTPMFSTQHFVALTNNYTLDIHGEGMYSSFYNFGLSHNNLWFNRFYTGLTTAFSNSESSGVGYLFGLSFARRTTLPNSLGFGVNINYFSTNFAQLGQYGLMQYPLQQTFFANYIIGDNLSLAAGYSFNQAIDDNKTMSIKNASLNWQMAKGFLINSTASWTSQYNMTSFGLNVGLAITLPGSQSLYTSYSLVNTNDYVTDTYASTYQYNSPTNIWGGSLGANYQPQNMSTPTTMSGAGYYLFKNFNVNAQGTYSSNAYNLSAGISGNAVVSGAGFNLGQYSSMSYIVVKIGNLPNIGIKQNGTVIGYTDRFGMFVIPNVQPYLSQTIEVNATDLPFNTQLDSYDKRVVAPLNGGARVEFYPVKFIAANVRVRYNNAKLPPVGYSATLYSDLDYSKALETTFILDNGLVSLSKFSTEHDYKLEFELKDGKYMCPISKTNVIPQNSNEYLFDLGTVQCTKI